MSQANAVRARRCHVCGVSYNTTAGGMHIHAILCDGTKPRPPIPGATLIKPITTEGTTYVTGDVLTAVARKCSKAHITREYAEELLRSN